MIDQRVILELAKRYQTSQGNVVREYFQLLFLSHLYKQKDSQNLFFKGGTALRMVWKSPRFSEDLDFTYKSLIKASPNTPLHIIESVLEKTLVAIESEGVDINIDEAKKTSGGYLSILKFKSNDAFCNIQIEISFRNSSHMEGETAVVSSDLLPPFALICLNEKIVIKEKIEALLTRAKPRDFFDLYFILRSHMAFKEVFQKEKDLKTKILKSLEKGMIDTKGELKEFLPMSYRGLLKNLKDSLAAEITRSFPD